MAKWDEAYAKLRAVEGGYSKHPNDRGGETYAGVARNVHPYWGGWEIVDQNRNLPGFPDALRHLSSLERLVEGFYRSMFWSPLDLEYFTVQSVANEVLDSAVNVGMRRAVTWLQQACNALNRNESILGDIAVDGILGKITLRAANRIAQLDETNLLKVLNVLQGAHYVRLVGRDPRQEAFMRGWLTRVRL